MLPWDSEALELVQQGERANVCSPAVSCGWVAVVALVAQESVGALAGVADVVGDRRDSRPGRGSGCRR